jgi:hypothetical protein
VTEWLDAVLEEYKAMRQEVLTSMQTQQSSLSFGAATLGILAAGGFNAWGEPVPAVAVFLVGIPTLSGLVVLVWLGELTRMQRAGSVLVEIETKVNEALASEGRGPALSWETALRERRLKLTWNYLAIMAAFALLAAGSFALGAAKGIDSALSEPLVWTLVGLEAATLGALALFVGARWRRLPRAGV